MTALQDPVALIQKDLDEWDGPPYVELDIFATDDARSIARIISDFCEEQLGSKPAGYLFCASGIGNSHGVKLEDGREVMIKARPPAHTNPDMIHDRKSLDIICQAMRWLQSRGYPCPKLLLGPTPIGRGLATVEEYFERGEHADAFQPAYRKIVAAGFFELIDRLRSFEGDVSGVQLFRRGAALYPQPHSKIFNFETTAAGAEWIDDFARRARRLEIADGISVLGHCDWRVEHLRFQEGRIVATYDWDSLVFRPETELVGSAANGFGADWSLPNVRRIPTGNDIRAFIADYEDTRGRPFSQRERQSAIASCVYCLAYGSRCGHSIDPKRIDREEDSAAYVLRTEGEALLAEAAG